MRYERSDILRDVDGQSSTSGGQFKLTWLFAWIALLALPCAIWVTKGTVFGVLLFLGTVTPFLVLFVISIVAIKDRWFSKPKTWESSCDNPLGIREPKLAAGGSGNCSANEAASNSSSIDFSDSDSVFELEL